MAGRRAPRRPLPSPNEKEVPFIKRATTRKLISAALLLLLALVLSFTADYFFSWKNICSMLREVSVIGLISVGVTFVIIGGGIDLSTGAVLAVSAILTSRLVVGTLLPIWLIVAAALAVGALCGLFNGILVTRLGLSEFIATFASMFIFRGIVYLLAFRENGRLVTKAVTDPAFRIIAARAGGFYLMSLVWAAAVLLGYLLLKCTRFGTYVYATGTNRKSAEFSGIRTARIRTATFIISGVCSALAGVLLLAWQGSVSLGSGSGMEFEAIAAVVVGGVSLTGGRGDTLGTALGSLFMIMAVNGLYKYGLSTEFQTIAYGVVIILMSVFDAVYFSMLDKRRRASLKQPGKGAAYGK